MRRISRCGTVSRRLPTVSRGPTEGQNSHAVIDFHPVSKPATIAPMDESIIDRIPRLERSVRFWRNTAFILAAILVSGLITGFGFLAVAQQRTVRAMEEAVQAEMVAREQAEVARRQAERALQEAKQQRHD